MFKWAILFAMPFAILFGVLFGGSSASAISAYDDLVRTTDKLEINQNGYVQDITLDWYSELLNNSDSTFQGTNPDIMRQCMSERLDDGKGWAISQSVFTSGIKQVVLVCASSQNEVATFEGLTPNRNVQVSNSIQCVFFSFSGALKLQCYSDYSYRIVLTETGVANEITPLFVNYDVNYPVDYEGQIIPDSYTPPIVYTYKPDISVLNVVDWKITLQDRNFNTFDGVPFTCDQGLAPIIEYDLFNNDINERIDQGVFSPTIPYEYQTEKYGIETEYKFIGNYYCGSEDGQPTFSHQTTYYFTVTKDGLFIRETVEDCITSSFPFVDINGCISNLELLLNSLSFGAIKFPKWEFDTSGCRTLGTIGDWINVPSSSRTVCPQFPSSVRNIVTPFVTFVIGATILGAIATKSSRSNL